MPMPPEVVRPPLPIRRLSIHAHVVVVAAVGERLAEADAAGEDAAVVLEHVVGDLHVVDVGLQLDAAGAVAVPGHQAEAVDAGGAEDAGSNRGGRRQSVVWATTVRSAPRSTVLAPPLVKGGSTYGAWAATVGIEGGGVLLEEAPVDDACPGC